MDSEDLEAQLLADLGSDSDSEEEFTQQNGNEAAGTTDDMIMETTEEDFDTKLNELIAKGKEKSIKELIETVDLSVVKDINTISKVSGLLGVVLDKIEEYSLQPLASVSGGNIEENEEYQFLIKINDLTSVIANEIQLIHSFIKTHYRLVYPELESLIPNPIDYVKIILTIKQDLSQVDDSNLQLREFLSGDKVLLITMSALHQLKSNSSLILTDDHLNKILKACELLLNLNSARGRIMNYVSSRLSIFAPNVTAIVGAECASQIITSVGGINSLAKTPSCNIAAIGSKKSVNLGMGHSSIRQQGYLYDCFLVQNCPIDLQKQAMRIISGKLVLAARIDLTHGSADGNMGRKWLKEIETKLDKLGEPPENKGPKALPIPIDKASKKRGGRRYRKFKEQFEMSELAKAQNKMVFGQAEESVIDGFGEEVGLGMANRTGLRSISLNKNTKAKMSKGMTQRLANSSNSNQINSIGDSGLAFLTPESKLLTNDSAKSKWLKSGAASNNPLKRKPSLSMESDKTKQQK